MNDQSAEKRESVTVNYKDKDSVMAVIAEVIRNLEQINRGNTFTGICKTAGTGYTTAMAELMVQFGYLVRTGKRFVPTGKKISFTEIYTMYDQFMPSIVALREKSIERWKEKAKQNVEAAHAFALANPEIAKNFRITNNGLENANGVLDITQPVEDVIELTQLDRIEYMLRRVINHLDKTVGLPA